MSNSSVPRLKKSSFLLILQIFDIVSVLTGTNLLQKKRKKKVKIQYEIDRVASHILSFFFIHDLSFLFYSLQGLVDWKPRMRNIKILRIMI